MRVRGSHVGDDRHAGPVAGREHGLHAFAKTGIEAGLWIAPLACCASATCARRHSSRYQVPRSTSRRRARRGRSSSPRRTRRTDAARGRERDVGTNASRNRSPPALVRDTRTLLAMNMPAILARDDRVFWRGNADENNGFVALVLLPLATAGAGGFGGQVGGFAIDGLRTGTRRGAIMFASCTRAHDRRRLSSANRTAARFARRPVRLCWATPRSDAGRTGRDGATRS